MTFGLQLFLLKKKFGSGFIAGANPLAVSTHKHLHHIPLRWS